MKNIYISLVTALAFFSLGSVAQNTTGKANRISVYSVLLSYPDQKFANDIHDAFVAIPTPDQFNNHDLSVKVIDVDFNRGKMTASRQQTVITEFLEKNLVASRLVGKWFNRDPYTGLCDMELLNERNKDNAADELIGNTYILVNSIEYVDKGKNSKLFDDIINGVGSLAGAFVTETDISTFSHHIADLKEIIKDFRIKTTSYLYRLEWNEEIAQNFLKTQYSPEPDQVKMLNFEYNRGKYTLKYVGKVESGVVTASSVGVNMNKPETMIRKVCQRAIDGNITALQARFEEFRTKAVLTSASPITAEIGVKDGVTKDTRYEVLERTVADDGSARYTRVGIIAPVAGQIWDNRYMALEEGITAACLGKTTFTKVSGGDFKAGMFIREIKK